MTAGQFRRVRHTANAALAAIAVVSAVRPTEAREGVYETTVKSTLVCPTGTFPVDAGGALVGTLTLTVDVRGRATGMLTLDQTIAGVKGRHKGRNDVQKLVLRGGKGRKRFKLTCSRGRTDDAMTGRLKDGGTFSRGRHTASVDVSQAERIDDDLSASIEPLPRAWFGGDGTASLCGEVLEINCSLRDRTVDTIWFETRRFRFRARGTASDDGFAITSAKLKGYGILVDVSPGDIVRRPLKPDFVIVTVSGHNLLGPPQPTLGSDIGPALQTEIENRGFRVYEYDFVDAPQTVEGDGFVGLVAKLREIRDAWVAGVGSPTHVVIVAYSHGGVWAHAATDVVFDLPIAAFIDLDTNSCDFDGLFGGHDTTLLGGSPIDRVEIDTVFYDLEDVIFPSVRTALEVISTSICPTTLERFDDSLNVRADGTDDFLFFHESTDDHFGVDSTAGAAYPVVRDWLMAVLFGN